MAVDRAGRPLRIDIGHGNQHDSQMIDTFLGWEYPPLAMVADKAYDTKSVRQKIEDEGALPVIPSKSNAVSPVPHDEGLYAMRNLVERFFCRMKDMRRLTHRYERTARNFRGMLYLFAIRQWAQI